MTQTAATPLTLFLVSGLSGAGKSIALQTLEDLGGYCIDNLPPRLLMPLALEELPKLSPRLRFAAVAMDVRAEDSGLDLVPAALDSLITQAPNLDIKTLFLEADDASLIRRFSETRRRHPLSRDRAEGQDALERVIQHERQLLEPLAARADLRLDTSQSNVHQLRARISKLVGSVHAHPLTLRLESFAFRNGVPRDADFVFDARALSNPHWEPNLRPLTGRDVEVADFLNADPLAAELFRDIEGLIRRWVPHFIASDRAYLTLAIGCTGGQHRSVYLIERLYAALQNSELPIRSHAHHRELGS
jgi:UPF0042 nucleotide-binding protein